MPTRSTIELNEQIKRYRWYHRIEVAPGLYTPSAQNQGRGCPELWDFIFSELRHVEFVGKRVLDVGCRDGLFSFEAERRGAAEIVGIDNDLSPGATQFLIPLFDSKVRMHELNVYDLTPNRFGTFDIILFLGVLYHLRYPFWGLKKITDCLAEDGLLVIESGMLVDDHLSGHEWLYCPVEDSPYEPTSCTFFSETALATTLRSFGCRLLRSRPAAHLRISSAGRRHDNPSRSVPPASSPTIGRQILGRRRDRPATPLGRRIGTTSMTPTHGRPRSLDRFHNPSEGTRTNRSPAPG